MSALIISPDPAHDRVRLLTRLLDQMRLNSTVVPDLEVAAKRAQAEGGLVFVPDLHDDPAMAEWAASAAEQTGPGLFLVYVAETLSAEHYKRLVRTGRADWIKWNTLPAEMIEVVRRRAGASQAPSALASIVSMLPAGGGVGATTVALETAVSLAGQRGKAARRVAILDLNLQHTAYPDYLDIEPRFDIAEINSNPDRLDDQLIDLFASKHASGVDVFCNRPGAIDYGALKQVVLFRVLDEIAKRYDIVLLDLPATWFPWVNNILLGSDLVCVVAGFSIPGVKRAARALKQIGESGVPPERTAVVINRFEAPWFGAAVSRADVVTALRGVELFFVHRDDAAAGDAVNTGNSIVRSKRSRRIRKDIAKLSQWLDRARQGRPQAAA